MIKLVLVRHGQSMWNLENKFTGWTDVELSPNGEKEADEAGDALKKGGYTFDLAFSSESDPNVPYSTSYNTKYIVQRWGW